MWMWTRESFPKVVLHKVRWWSQWTCYWIQQGHWIRCWDHRYLCSRLHCLLCYWPKEERKGLPCSCMCSVYTIPLQSSINYPNELWFSTINPILKLTSTDSVRVGVGTTSHRICCLHGSPGHYSNHWNWYQPS